MFRTASFLISALFLCGISASAQYAGRYTDGDDYAVYFEQTSYGLTIRPVMWTATQLLRETGKDKFVVVDRTSRGAEFRRDPNGDVVGVVVKGMDGEGLELKRQTAPMLPVELLLLRREREAARAYVNRKKTARAIDDAEQVLRRLPTMTRSMVTFLEILAPRFQTDARFHRLLGSALVQAGDRTRALKSFRKSYELNSDDAQTISALRRLGHPPMPAGEAGWSIPFSLDAVFAKPTAAEIRAVEKDWTNRDLEPRGERAEATGTLELAGQTFNVRIVSHLVHGKRHYGAVITPQKVTGRRLPVLIDAKGVSPTYFPLDLSRIAAPRMMADRAGEFIYVVPSFRGEVLNFGGVTYTSEGDRTDALDGATDDTIALLNVAIKSTPEIDPDRICAFGHSRGGTVAMLTGIRDQRVQCVVNWAGPTDWFYAMGTNGWTEQELWQEALRTRANPQQPGGQNVERFLKRAIDGTAGLGDIRLRMIASSPLYFASRLPKSQHHYGEEDPSVPVTNGTQLCNRLRGKPVTIILDRPIRCDLSGRHQAYFYAGEGHDTDRIHGPVYSRTFILETLRTR